MKKTGRLAPNRKSRIAFVLCFALLAASLGTLLPACSAPADTTGFKGLKWGEPSESAKNLALLAEEGDFKFLTDTAGKPELEGVPVDKVVYGFFKNRFYSALVYFSAESAFPTLKDALVKRYGDPVQPDAAAKKYFWNLNTINILLTYDDAAKGGKASYFYKPIQTEAELGQEGEKPKAE